MPSIYDLKPKFQGLLRPWVGSLAKSGVTANQVTILACLLSILTGTLLYCWPTDRWALLLVPAVLFLRMALNAVDGMLAREFGQKSRLGAVLNELTDVISDAALYLPFALVLGLDFRLVIAGVVIGIIGEMAGVVALQVGAQRRYDGPMGKSDRAFIFGLIALLLGLGKEPGWWLTAFQYLIIILGIITIINRSRRALATGAAT